MWNSTQSINVFSFVIVRAAKDFTSHRQRFTFRLADNTKQLIRIIMETFKHITLYFMVSWYEQRIKNYFCKYLNPSGVKTNLNLNNKCNNICNARVSQLFAMPPKWNWEHGNSFRFHSLEELWWVGIVICWFEYRIYNAFIGMFVVIFLPLILIKSCGSKW